MGLYIAILHYPVYDKNKKIVTTSIANINIHDISRTAKTYGINACYIVTPLVSQQRLIYRIIEHWVSGYGAQYNISRKEALDIIRVTETLEGVLKEIKEDSCGEAPLIVITSAKVNNGISYKRLRSNLKRSRRPILIIFGTGWGLEKSVKEQADFCLEPILGPTEYNHLSVRSAVAITLDRLLGSHK